MPQPKSVDVESQAAPDRAIEMTARTASEEKPVEADPDRTTSTHDAAAEHIPVAESSSAANFQPTRRSALDTSRTSNDAGASSDKDVIPSAIGHETCPICIVSRLCFFTLRSKNLTVVDYRTGRFRSRR